MSITDVLCMLYGLHTHMALLLAPSRMKQFSTVVALNLPFGLHRRIVDCVFSMSTIIRHSRAIVSLANATISSRGAQHGLAVLVTDAAFVETIICSASACLATDVYVESIGLVADVRCSIVGARNINHVELTTVTDVYRRWAIDRINTSRRGHVMLSVCGGNSSRLHSNMNVRESFVISDIGIPGSSRFEP